MQEYNEIKLENMNFRKKFKQTEKIEEFSNRKNLRNESKTDATFRDLIRTYRNKGYKIPDLSTKRNLFNPTPLLLEPHRIEDYYKYKDVSSRIVEDNSTKFLGKLNIISNERLQSNDLESEIFNKKITTTKKETKKQLNKINNVKFSINNADVQQELDEIKENENYNNKIRTIIREGPEESLSDISDEPFSEHNTKSKLHVRHVSELPHEIDYSKDNTKSRNLSQILPESNSTTLIDINQKNKYMSIDNSSTKFCSIEIPKNSTDGDHFKKIPVIPKLSNKKYSNLKNDIRSSKFAKKLTKMDDTHSEHTKSGKNSILLNSPSKTLLDMKIHSERQSERDVLVSQFYDKIIHPTDNYNIKELFAIYTKKFWNYDDKMINDYFNKKIDPISILKSISDIKLKVNAYNVPDRFRFHYSMLNQNDFGYLAVSRIMYNII
jgi:hypothetical protein